VVDVVVEVVVGVCVVGVVVDAVVGVEAEFEVVVVV
jgi:hypothetical protein